MSEVPVQPKTPDALSAHETEHAPRIEQPNLRNNADVRSTIARLLGYIDSGLRVLGARMRQVGRDNAALRTRLATIPRPIAIPIDEPGPLNGNDPAYNVAHPVPLRDFGDAFTTRVIDPEHDISRPTPQRGEFDPGYTRNVTMPQRGEFDPGYTRNVTMPQRGEFDPGYNRNAAAPLRVIDEPGHVA